MDTSLIAQPNKPTFGTSGFAVSPVESSEFIDATAEETCPAETTPMPERRAVDEVTEAVSAASLEVMDQLKALAHNVTQSTGASSVQDDASVQSDESEDTRDDADASDHGEPQAPEPSISVLPRPTGFENNPAINDRPKFGTRVLTLAGFVVAALIGVGGTFAWQDHLKSDDVATAASPAPVVAAPVIPPYLGRQLEELSQDISSMRRRMEELTAEQKRLAALQQQFEQLAVKQQTLAAKQDQAGQSIVKLQTLEQARQRTPAPVQSRPVPVPPPPVQSTMPPPPPQTAAHPVPPLPVPQR
jgi:DNA repair exonuclease SbcCD ATPase subunit